MGGFNGGANYSQPEQDPNPSPEGDIIMELKKYIRSNVNTKLIIDKLIIMMKKVK